MPAYDTSRRYRFGSDPLRTAGIEEPRNPPPAQSAQALLRRAEALLREAGALLAGIEADERDTP